ncbi:MAG: hypothetical protein QXT63_04900, partial [Thermoplasmata archaeon]
MKKEGVVKTRKTSKVNKAAKLVKLMLAMIAIVLLFGTPYIATLGLDDTQVQASAQTFEISAKALISDISDNSTKFDAKIKVDFSNYETFQRTEYGMNEKDRWSKFTYDHVNHNFHKSLNTSYIRVWIDKAQPNPKPGVWDFKTLDDYVNSVYSSGAQPFMSISYAPDHLSKNGFGNELNYPNDRAAFARYCAEIVRHYNIEQKRGIKYWEIWNEPWWDEQSMNEYILIFNEAAKAMKSVDPSIKVGGPGNAWYIPEWVDATLQKCPQLDFIPWHIYNGDRSGSSDWQILDDTTIYERTAKDARERIEKYRPNSNVEIMITELNSVSKWNPTTDPRISYQFNAAWYASALNHLIRGGIDKEFYFEGTCSDDPYHNFGMWSETGTIRPTYWTKMLFSQYAPYGSTVVNSTSTNHKIESLAIIEDTSNLFIINKENKTMHTFVNITGISALSQTNQNQTEPDAQTQTQAKNVTLYMFSENTFNANSSNAIEKKNISLQNGTFEIDLPGYSIAVIVIESLPDVLNIEADQFACKPMETKPTEANLNTQSNMYSNSCLLKANESISNLANYGKGNKTIIIKASNEINETTNQNPRMVLKLNGTKIGEANVSNGWTNYTFSANLSGKDSIEITCVDSDNLTNNVSNENQTIEKRIVIDWISIENPKEVEDLTNNANLTNEIAESNLTTNDTEPSPQENETEKNTTQGTGLSILVPVIKIAEPVETTNDTQTYIRPATVTAANLTQLDMTNGSIEIGVSEIELTEKGTLEKRTMTTTVPMFSLDSWNREPGLMALAFEFAIYYTSALSTAILLLARRTGYLSLF